MNAWHENEPLLKSWLIKQTGHQDKAEDLLQDLFVKAMQHKAIFCTTDDAKSWLFKVAKNALIDDYRKSKHFVGILPDDIEDKPIQENTSSLTDLQHCLLRVMLELDHADKDIIEQCDIQGLQQADYARLNQLSLSATKSRLQRARKKIREQMVMACKIQFEDNKVCCFTPRK
jgi:RNA polymerase sigma-70 factor (ECF subfamily)